MLEVRGDSRDGISKNIYFYLIRGREAELKNEECIFLRPAHLLSGSAKHGVYLPLGFREPVERQIARVLRDPDRD